MNPDAQPLVDLELERTVLGQMLAHGAYGVYLQAGLTREGFYRGVHGLIWEAIEATEGAGQGSDLRVVWQELKRRQVDDAVGIAYFSALLDGVPNPSAATAHALSDALLELARKREIHQTATKLAANVRSNTDALSGVGFLTEHLGEIEKILRGGGEYQKAKEAPAQLTALREDYALDRQGKVWLGFPKLDGIIGGCRAGEVCGLMARPGIGKTLILGHLARVTAEAELPHVFFSLEMPTAQIVMRLARAVYRLGKRELEDRIESGTLDDLKYIQIFGSLVIVDTPGLTLADMATHLRVLQAGVFRDRPIRLVTIDHLGLVGGDRRLNTYDRVSLQSRETKDLAKRLNASILLAIQVSREAGGDGSKELSLGAARDSGVVEEAMDYLIGFRRLDKSVTLSNFERDKYRDCLFAKVIKNRHDREGEEVGIRLDGRTLHLTEDAFLSADANDLARIANPRR